MQENINDNIDIFNEIYSLVYPIYPIGCSSNEFLQAHKPLFEALIKFDQSQLSHSTLESLAKSKNHKDQNSTNTNEDFGQFIIEVIIKLLNEACSFCHRKQLSDEIFKHLRGFKGNLINLAIGKTQYKFSFWQQQLTSSNIVNALYEIKNLQKLQIIDQIYQKNKKITHLECGLIDYSEVFILKEKLERIIHESQSNLPLSHRYYLGVIASSTYGSKYIWNKCTKDFIRAGGDLNWIQTGVSAAPEYLQDMSRYSSYIAFNFKKIFNEKIFTKQRNSKSGSVDNQYKLEALLILIYYQSLSCLSLVYGIIPEQEEYQKYLPDFPSIKPSFESFETIKKNVGKYNQYEKKIAEEFTNTYSWNEHDDMQQKLNLTKRSELIKSKSEQQRKKIKDLEQQQKTYLLSKVEQEQIIEKIKQSQTLKLLRKKYAKYVNFEYLQNILMEEESLKEQQQLDLILSSDWDFAIKTLNTIQSCLGSKYRKGLNDFISSLKFLDKDKSKNLKIYYQSFNNYMHEYITQITQAEKNYLKLITKSPFLFTELSYQKMRMDLLNIDIDAKEFVLEAIGFKFQLNVSFLTYLYDKIDDENSQEEIV